MQRAVRRHASPIAVFVVPSLVMLHAPAFPGFVGHVRAACRWSRVLAMRPPAVVGERGDDAERRRAVALERDRRRLDRRRRRRRRPARLAARAARRPWPGSSRVDAPERRASGGRADQTAAACFDDVPAERGRAARTSPGSARSTSTIARDRVRRVVVDRSAREAETAGDGERPRVVVGDAERARRDLHRRREARVEIEARDVVEARCPRPPSASPRRSPRSPGDSASDQRSVTK